MTNKEASEKLKEILFMTGYKEALDLAIKALETIDLIKFNIHALNELVKDAENET